MTSSLKLDGKPLDWPIIIIKVGVWLIVITVIALISYFGPKSTLKVESGLHENIVCYSGGTKVFEGEAEGEIRVYNQDGWARFTDSTTKREVVINADCIVRR